MTAPREWRGQLQNHFTRSPDKLIQGQKHDRVQAGSCFKCSPNLMVAEYPCTCRSPTLYPSRIVGNPAIEGEAVHGMSPPTADNESPELRLALSRIRLWIASGSGRTQGVYIRNQTLEFHVDTFLLHMLKANLVILNPITNIRIHDFYFTSSLGSSATSPLVTSYCVCWSNPLWDRLVTLRFILAQVMCESIGIALDGAVQANNTGVNPHHLIFIVPIIEKPSIMPA